MSTEIAPTRVTPEGVGPVFVAAAAGDTLRCGPGVMLVAKNSSGAERLVVVPALARCDQGELHDVLMHVPAGGEAKAGPVDAARYGNGSGIASISYDFVAGVTIGALILPA